MPRLNRGQQKFVERQRAIRAKEDALGPPRRTDRPSLGHTCHRCKQFASNEALQTEVDDDGEHIWFVHRGDCPVPVVRGSGDDAGHASER